MKQYKTRKLMILFAILILVMVPFSSVMAQDAGLQAGEVVLQAELQNAGHVSVKLPVATVSRHLVLFSTTMLGIAVAAQNVQHIIADPGDLK